MKEFRIPQEVLFTYDSKTKYKDNNYFKVHVLEVMLTVSEKKQPKSYQKIKEWYESDEPEINPMLFSTYELAK